MKSKKEGKACQIRLDVEAEERHVGSPNGKPKLVRLDVEAEWGTDEVQKGSQSLSDWTLKRRKGTRKSKKEAKVWWIGR